MHEAKFREKEERICILEKQFKELQKKQSFSTNTCVTELQYDPPDRKNLLGKRQFS